MKQRRILITGARGMLAREIVSACRARDWEVLPRPRSELDITDQAAVRRDIQANRPDIVINCAAYTNVDGAEEEEATAMRINGLGPEVLARECSLGGALLVQYSTDYIFSGRFSGPIPVDAPPDPINAYGRTKLAGERAALNSGADCLVLRTSWLYASHGTNFVRTMLRLGAERRSLNVVDDQRGRPTFCPDLAQATCGLIECDAKGVFHVANDGDCTWFELAERIMQLAAIDCEVLPCTSAMFPRPAQRPAYSVLDLTATAATVGGSLRHWNEAVEACINEILGAGSPPARNCGANK